MPKLKTSESHPLRVDFLSDEDAPFRGRIGLTFAPGKHQLDAQTGAWARDLTVDMRRLSSTYSTRLLVSLIEDHELRELKVEGLPAAAAVHNVRLLRLPFPDGGVPSLELANQAVAAILDTAANQGHDVVIHCKGGLGRTGLIAACALVAAGMDADRAIKAVRSARKGTIENAAQADFVRAFERSGNRLVPEAAEPVPTLASIRGCLLGGAIGDALGYPIEFEKPGSKLALRYGASPPKTLRYANGENRFSDDTQMTLFVAEGLIRGLQRFIDRGVGGQPKSSIERAMLRWLATQERVPEGGVYPTNGWLFEQKGLHQRRAPGNTCLSALRAQLAYTKDGSGPGPTNDSKGCGAVMRSAPIGFPPYDRAEAFNCARETGRFTHGHPSGYLSAAYFAAVIWGVARRESLAEAMRHADVLLAPEEGSGEMRAIIERVTTLAEQGAPSAETIEALGGGWVGEEAIGIALLCALTADQSESGVRDALWRSVLHGGDSDSTGSLTGNLLGAMLGIEALPREWLAEVEMRDVVDRIAKDLFASQVLGRALDFEVYPPN